MSNEWDISKGEWRDASPLGMRIEDFILEWPEFIIYLRKDNRFPCPKHYSQSSESVSTLDIDCDCLGFGVKTTAAIVPCRLSRGDARMDHRDGDNRQMLGFIGSWRDIVHFPRAVAPVENDIVIVCSWNVPMNKILTAPNPRPVVAHSIYLIRELNSQFQRELGWFSCGIKGFDIAQDQMDKLVYQKFGNLPILEEESSWPQRSYW